MEKRAGAQADEFGCTGATRRSGTAISWISRWWIATLCWLPLANLNIHQDATGHGCQGLVIAVIQSFDRTAHQNVLPVRRIYGRRRSMSCAA